MEILELRPVESNRDIETEYRDELLSFFNSGLFIFDKEFRRGKNQTINTIALQNALISHYSNDKLKQMTRKLFDKISSYHRSEFDHQIQDLQIKGFTKKAVVNVENSQSYQAYTEQLKFFNYVVTKNLKDDFIYGIMLSLLMQKLFNPPKQVEDQIVEDGVNRINERIEIISTDQVIKITQGLTIAKCKGLGLDRYKWQTMEDDKVRPTHAANNQKVFGWDNPPAKTGHPGTEINCRCKPVIIVDKVTANLVDLM